MRIWLRAAGPLMAAVLSGCVSVPQEVVSVNEVTSGQLRTLKSDSIAILNAYEEAVVLSLHSGSTADDRFDEAVRRYDGACPAGATTGLPEVCTLDRTRVISTLNEQMLAEQLALVRQEFAIRRDKLSANFDETLRINGVLGDYLKSARSVVEQRNAFAARVGSMVSLDIDNLTSQVADCLGGTELADCGIEEE